MDNGNKPNSKAASKQPDQEQKEPLGANKKDRKLNGHEFHTVLASESKESIAVKIRIEYEDDECTVHCVYSEQEKLRNLIDPIINAYEVMRYPLKMKLSGIEKNYQPQLNDVDAVTMYDGHKLVEQGLEIRLSIAKYQHRVQDTEITCKHMKMKQSQRALDCPVYYAMKEEYEFSEQHLAHLAEFTHFESERVQKAECRYKDKCKAFMRMEQGRGNRLDDRCHLALYRHPPRSRNIKLAQNVHAFICNTKDRDLHWLHDPCIGDERKYVNRAKRDGWLLALIDEVVANGYKSDLCLKCGADDECKHDEYSLLQVVDDKMRHIRHRAMDSPLTRDLMLALVLYTGCECNYDLCASQRNGDYEKWKWFDRSLWYAIRELSGKEEGCFSVFSGLDGVKLDKKQIQSGYFVTYVSTSWSKEVAEEFMGGGKGMIIEFQKEYKNTYGVHCCDVSWISKFPDECEVLFARSVTCRFDWSNFKCEVANDHANGLQTVTLKHVRSEK